MCVLVSQSLTLNYYKFSLDTISVLDRARKRSPVQKERERRQTDTNINIYPTHSQRTNTMVTCIMMTSRKKWKRKEEEERGKKLRAIWFDHGLTVFA